MVLTAQQQNAWNLSAQGVVVDMKTLTGENVNRQRMDIDVLLTKYPDTFNLMLQALIKMQQDSSNVGYFQLGGIHGWPTGLWDFVPQKGWRQTSGNTWDNNVKKFEDGYGGYCAHGVYIFGTWHRPYLALLEQTLYRTIRDIAESYTDSAVKAKYLRAVQEFRLPYFDYFRPRGEEVVFPDTKDGKGRPTKFPYDFRLPDIFMEPKVSIRFAPADTLTPNIANPLYTYRFKDSKSGQLLGQDRLNLADWATTDLTIRAPPNGDAKKATFHDAKQISWNLNKGCADRCAMLLAMMKDHAYDKFSTIATDSELATGDLTSTNPRREQSDGNGSLEDIHNKYHYLIGYGGHMGAATVAAFDPVFWFHHCNIDRYFALWQAAHPHEWFPLASKQGETYEGSKPLLPFYKSRTAPGKGSYWTSDDVKDTAALGYTYDDFAQITPGKSGVEKYINDNYLWATYVPDDSTLRSPPEAMKPKNKEVRAAYFFSKPATPAHSSTDARSSRMAMAAPHADSLAGSSSLASTVDHTAASVAGSVGTATQAVLALSSGAPTNKIDPVFDREWYVDSKVKRAAANGPFTIYFFLALHGELAVDPVSYGSSRYLAGFHHIFASPREGCDNCASAEEAGKLSVSTTPISSLLLEYLDLPDNGLESLQPEHVKPFLLKYLRWRVVYQRFESQDPRGTPNLTIGVSAKVYHEEGVRTYEEYPEVIEEIIANASAASGA